MEALRLASRHDAQLETRQGVCYAVACLASMWMQDDPILYDEVRDSKPSAPWAQANNGNAAYAAVVHGYTLNRDGGVMFLCMAPVEDRLVGCPHVAGAVAHWHHVAISTSPLWQAPSFTMTE